MAWRETRKRRVFEHLSRVPKALANAHRLEMIEILAQSEKTVEALARETDQSMANASQHLQVLRRAGLVAARRVGTYAYYRLAGEEVHRLWQSVRALGEAHLAELDRLLSELHADTGELDALTLEELRDRVEAGSTVLLDVRPSEEYAAGHIAGALSMPVADLSARLAELPEDAEVVAYCRGPYCVFADEAVAILQRQGIPARRLEEGFPDWRAAGLPTEGSHA